MQAQTAYSLFTVKALDAANRKFSGVATSPSLDRVGDRINPLGVKYTNPLVLLHQHQHDEPIGSVVFKKPTKNGIEFEASIPVVDREGLFKDRVDMAWDEISYGVVRAVSIGFRPIKYSFTDTGIDYEEVDVYELSSVSIPALPDAIIAQVKSMDGAPLPREIVKSIRLADRSNAIKLVVPPKSGAIKLIR